MTDTLTDNWTLWKILIENDRGYREAIKVRAMGQGEAFEKALGHRPGWSIAVDPYGNPLVWREPTNGYGGDHERKRA